MTEEQLKQLTDFAATKRKEDLLKIREEIAQIKATKIYSTIDLKDMVLAIIDKHMEEHHD
jgi:hypothetical protein